MFYDFQISIMSGIYCLIVAVSFYIYKPNCII